MDEEHRKAPSLDWRILFGLAVTSIWIGAGLVYLASIVGWRAFVFLPTADIGSFFEGAFAPLAFLWLVIGHFMQQKEITANTHAITLQERSTRRMELHSRRDSYFKLLNLVQDQLGNIAAFHFISAFGPTGSNEMDMDEFSSLRGESSMGDPLLFVRRMVSACAALREDEAGLRELLYGTDVRTRHSENFKKTFGRLIRASESVDTEGMVHDALLEGSVSGIYYKILLHVSGEESFDPISGQRMGSGLAPVTQFTPSNAEQAEQERIA
ncbi:MAG: hypothetical protein AAGG55_15400 [Pseudomonadota bacterium]